MVFSGASHFPHCQDFGTALALGFVSDKFAAAVAAPPEEFETQQP